MCAQKSYTKLSYLASTSPKSFKAVSQNSDDTQAVGQNPAGPLLCANQWKTVYGRAYTLEQNWREGKYYLSPLLRGHSKPVSSIECDGELKAVFSQWCQGQCDCLQAIY